MLPSRATRPPIDYLLVVFCYCQLKILAHRSVSLAICSPRTLAGRMDMQVEHRLYDITPTSYNEIFTVITSLKAEQLRAKQTLCSGIWYRIIWQKSTIVSVIPTAYLFKFDSMLYKHFITYPKRTKHVTRNETLSSVSCTHRSPFGWDLYFTKKSLVLC